MRSTRLAPLFPEDPNPELRTSAVVYVDGDEDRVRDILRALPGIRAVYRPGEWPAQSQRPSAARC